MRHELRMSFGVTPGGAGDVNTAFDSFAETHAMPAAVRRSFNVALDELLANSLTYGLAGRDACSVSIEMEMDQDCVTVILTDDGPPFDPFKRDAPDTTLSVEDRPIGGLGILLVQRLMDDVKYQRRDDHNVVVLVKKLVNVQKTDFSEGT